jgi:hypothetical protein
MKKLKLNELEVTSFIPETESAKYMKAGAAEGPTEHAGACPFTQALRDPLCAPTGLCINW